jgi:DNA invertase Pin-like site-specific DNA recombinase
VGPYEDNSKTAADPTKDRPDYDRMMRDIRARKIDVVVVGVSDRLHRQPVELEQFIADAKAAGMTRLRTDRSREYDLNDYDAIRDMRKEVIDAAYEVDRLSHRIRRAMLDIAERGGWNGGKRPFGYQAVDKQLVVDEVEAQLIREAAQRVLEGGTLYSIAKSWKEASVPTVRGAIWNINTVRQILQSPRIAGLRSHGKSPDGKPVIVGEAAWDAIVDREVWEKVVLLLSDPARRTTKPSRSYPLVGVMQCGECGHRMAAAVVNTKRTYECKRMYGGCGVNVNADRAEGVIYSEMLPLADDPKLRDVVAQEEAGTAEQAERLVLENATDGRKLAELSDMLTDDEMDRATYTKQSKKLRRRIEGRQVQLAGMRTQSALDRLGGNVESSWDSMTPEDRLMVTKALIDHVKVSSASRRGVFDPDRLDIVWKYEAIAKIVKMYRTPDGRRSMRGRQAMYNLSEPAST